MPRARSMSSILEMWSRTKPRSSMRKNTVMDRRGELHVDQSGLRLRRDRLPARGNQRGHDGHREVSAKPQRPDHVDHGVGHDGGENLAMGSPRPAIENSRDTGQQHISPVEGGAVMEMGEAEQNGAEDQCPAAP